jgi:hypothetical protein
MGDTLKAKGGRLKAKVQEKCLTISKICPAAFRLQLLAFSRQPAFPGVPTGI